MQNVLNDEQAVLYSHYLYAMQRKRLLIETIAAKLEKEFVDSIRGRNEESGSLD